MTQQIIKGTTKLSKKIRSRRLELGLTIEEAASKAGIGTKTWCRYEAGESMRKDKAKGVCKALNWKVIPSDVVEDDSIFNMDEYKNHEAWSEYISECYGEAAAISFVIGSDIVLDYIEEDLSELERLPKGSHVGQLKSSMIKDILPEQFLMQYDYEFLYCLKICIMRLRNWACNSLVAHSVMEELALYLFVEASEFLMETMFDEMKLFGIEDVDEWNDWLYDVLGDMDIITWLYSNNYLDCNHTYHFSHWMEAQFYCE